MSKPIAPGHDTFAGDLAPSDHELRDRQRDARPTVVHRSALLRRMVRGLTALGVCAAPMVDSPYPHSGDAKPPRSPGSTPSPSGFPWCSWPPRPNTASLATSPRASCAVRRYSPSSPLPVGFSQPINAATAMHARGVRRGVEADGQLFDHFTPNPSSSAKRLW